MYFGLQTGWVTMGSIQAALLGLRGFGPKENTLIQTTSVAAATMPLAAGFVGIIPALRLYENVDSSFHFGWGDIFIWSTAVAFFGVFLAVPLRKQTILKEKLRFPSGTATAHLITTLHGRAAKPHATELASEESASVKAKDDNEEEEHSNSTLTATLAISTSSVTPTDDQALMASDALGHASLRTVWRILFMCFAASSFYTLLTLFFPILGQIPIFSWIGLHSFTEWSWVLTPSLSYVGQGMIMGTRAGLSLLGGALLGWAILGPMARSLEWVPGPIYNVTKGAQGWLLWLSLAIMLADSMSSLVLLAVKSISAAVRSRREPHRDVVDPALPEEQVPVLLWGGGLALSSISCFILVSVAFSLPLYQPLIALILAYGVAVLAVRALGETDLNPVSGVGKVSQLVFAFVAPGNIVSNILAGGIAEAGAQQAGDLMQDLKTGHLVGASPRAQFYGQLIGSACSVVFSLAAYKLYTVAYEIPSAMFPVPTVWLAMAQLATGEEAAWPAHVFPFCIAFGLVAASLPLISEAYPHIAGYLPSGIAAAVGMYLTPNWTLPRAVGCLLNILWERRDPQSHGRYAVVMASGFVLGEGVTSIFTAILSALGVNCKLLGFDLNDPYNSVGPAWRDPATCYFWFCLEMAAPSSPSKGKHRRNLSVTNIALRSGSAASGIVHLCGCIWVAWQFSRLSSIWAAVFALPLLLLSLLSSYLNLRKQDLLAFSNKRRTRTLVINLVLSIIWAISCALSLWQTFRSYRPLPLLVPAVCGGMSLFAAWNAAYAVVLALGPGEK